MKAGDLIETTVRDVAFGGDGVGLVGDMVIFVPFAVDGDRVQVEVTEVRKRFARGKIIKILEYSPHRAVAPCRYFGRCGGCQYQHIRYAHQLELKERQVREAFARIGKMRSLPLESIKPSPGIFNYRGKAEYHVHHGGENQGAIGFVHVSGSGVVDLEDCMILDGSINRACRVLRETMPACLTEASGTRLTIWSGESGGSGWESVTGSGRPSSVERFVGGRRFLVPYKGFFQANLFLVEQLAEQVIDMCGLAGGETFLDLYCGSGLFAAFAAPRARRVFGIEADEEAVRCAVINLGREGEGKTKFFRGDAAKVMAREFVKGGIAVDAVILDPPRTGCSRKVLDTLVAMRPARIIYVSCNPATQARDCSYLTGRDFSLRRLQPVDMFPQTGHIEVVGLLERRAG